MLLLKCAIRRSIFWSMNPRRSAGDHVKEKRRLDIYEGVGFAILSDDCGCSVEF